MVALPLALVIGSLGPSHILLPRIGEYSLIAWLMQRLVMDLLHGVHSDNNLDLTRAFYNSAGPCLYYRWQPMLLCQLPLQFESGA